MKQLTIALLMLVTVSMTSCFKEFDYTFNEKKIVELEDAVRRTPASGVSYPIISVTRTAGSQSLQVNLVGEQLKAAQDMTFSIDTAISGLLNASTIRAEAGTHFNLNGGKFTFKQDTSFSFIKFDVLNVPAQTGKTALLLLKLEGNSEITANPNYNRVGFRIDLK
ncbi:MAG: hypothetical protein JNL70_24710 [Saprospiraceae bacterium]|nr:hypothetical protein [Saprospiraceae bacterium]